MRLDMHGKGGNGSAKAHGAYAKIVNRGMKVLFKLH
jgi:hypothetical protein